MANLDNNTIFLAEDEEIVASSLRERAFNSPNIRGVNLPPVDRKNQIVIIQKDEGDDERSVALLSCYRDAVSGKWLMVQHEPKEVTRRGFYWYHMDASDERIIGVEGRYLSISFKKMGVVITTDPHKKKALFYPERTTLCRFFLGRTNLGEMLGKIYS